MQSVNEILYFLPGDCFEGAFLILCVQDRPFFPLIYSFLIAQERHRRRIPASKIPKKPRVSGVNELKMLKDLLVFTNDIKLRVNIFSERLTVGGKV